MCPYCGCAESSVIDKLRHNWAELECSQCERTYQGPVLGEYSEANDGMELSHATAVRKERRIRVYLRQHGWRNV